MEDLIEQARENNQLPVCDHHGQAVTDLMVAGIDRIPLAWYGGCWLDDQLGIHVEIQRVQPVQ